MTPQQRAERVAKSRRRRREEPHKDREYQAKYRMVHRARALVRHSKRRSVESRVPFDLDKHIQKLQKRINRGVCELTGERFDLTIPRAWNSPSLDRINPKKGYVYGNIRIVCFAVNCALGNWGVEIAIRVLKSLERNRR